jgi:hypothetical protein
MKFEILAAQAAIFKSASGAHHPKSSAEKVSFSMAETRSDQTLKYNPSIKRNSHRAPSNAQTKI